MDRKRKRDDIEDEEEAFTSKVCLVDEEDDLDDEDLEEEIDDDDIDFEDNFEEGGDF